MWWYNKWYKIEVHRVDTQTGQLDPGLYVYSETERNKEISVYMAVNDNRKIRG